MIMKMVQNIGKRIEGKIKNMQEIFIKNLEELKYKEKR